MKFSITALRDEAVKAGHAAESAVFQFIDSLESKAIKIEQAKAVLTEAGYTVVDPQPEAPQAPVAPA